MASTIMKASLAVQDCGPVGCCTIEPAQAEEIVRAVLRSMLCPDKGVVLSSGITVGGHKDWQATINAMLEDPTP